MSGRTLPEELQCLEASIDDCSKGTLCNFLGRTHDALIAIEAEAASAHTLAHASKAKAEIEMCLRACGGFPRMVSHG